MSDKKLDEIEPAKTGVKLKRKTPPLKPKEQEKPQVISNVVAPENVPIPTEDAIRINIQINTARQKLIKSMRDFNKLMTSNILSENRSSLDKDEEQKIITELTKSAQEIDYLCQGEGSLALSVFAVRQAISFRDAGNKLAYEIEELKKKFCQFKTPEGEDEAKRKVLELAKQLGVKVDLK